MAAGNAFSLAHCLQRILLAAFHAVIAVNGVASAAGSRNVLELHGTIHRNYCMKCGQQYHLEAVSQAEGIPRKAEDLPNYYSLIWSSTSPILPLMVSAALSS